MKKMIIGSVVFAVGLLTSEITQAQGTTTYLSNLEQTTTGSRAVGSNSWLAVVFFTGTNVGGYMLNSVQLAMTDALGNPSGFKAMLYTDVGIGGPRPGSSLESLNGSTNPTTGGTYSYADGSNLMLSPQTSYFIVLTAGTAIANGAYEWGLANANSYNPSGGWSWAGYFNSSNGSSWSYIPSVFPQFAINATPIPEPGVLDLFVLGGLAFLRHRRKAKVV